MSVRLFSVIVCCILGVCTASAADTDSLKSHWGFGMTYHPNWQIPLDEWIRAWLYDRDAFAVNVEATYSSLPADSSAYDADFGYPTLAVGLRYGDNHHVTMKKSDSRSYFSHLGNTLTLYGAFSRPFFRTSHWEADYTLGTGLGYSSLIYNVTNDIDNELIGSHLSVYFNTGLHLTYHPVPEWGIRLGAEFCHHSNGALNRPNKGANSVGPSLSLVYTPYYKATVHDKTFTQATWQRDFSKYAYLDISVGVGAKTLLDDWFWTMEVPKSHPDYEKEYHNENFKLYMAYSLHTKLMFRYARRWASGIGADLFYGDYDDRQKYLDECYGRYWPHSPWSVGLSASHSVFYHRFSLQMSVGYYLFREMGYGDEPKPYYERIGIFYTVPALHDLTLGLSLNAQLTKADFTEIVLSYPIKL